MALYKYVSAEGGLRFVRTWALRLTPPAEFNDPFELRPPAHSVISDGYAQREFLEAAPAMLEEELTSQLTLGFAGILTDADIQDLVAYLMPNTAPTLENHVSTVVLKKIPRPMRQSCISLRTQFRAQYPEMLNQARRQMNEKLPALNAAVETSLHNMSGMLGVLCFTRNGNQPLMWAHYGESHRGLMLEFDEAHPTFNRRRTDSDEFGFLRQVVYSQKRPELSMDTLSEENAFEIWALTKSHHWSYEEESRLLWPLSRADDTVEAPGGAISLLSCPPAAIRSITFGCNSNEVTQTQVKQALHACPDAAHIQVRKARMDDVQFDLTYDLVSP